MVNRREAIVALASFIGVAPSLAQAGYDSRLAASRSRIDGMRSELHVGGFSSFGDGGAALYRRRSLADLDKAGIPAPLRFRSQDRHLPDGRLDEANGGYWALAEDFPTPGQVGCDPTGKVDATAALQALFTVGRANITGGTFKVSAPLKIPAGVVPRIVGDRTGILKATAEFTTRGWMIQHAGDVSRYTQGGEISGFVLDGYARWPADLTVPSFTLADYIGGIYVSNANNFAVHHMHVRGMSNCSVAIKHGDSNRVHDNLFEDGSYRSKVILFFADRPRLVTNSQAYNNISLRNGPTRARDASADGLYASCDGIHIDDGYGGQVYNNRLVQCGGIGIRIENTHDVDVFGNVIEDCGMDAIAIYQNSRRAHVHGNTILGFGRMPYSFAMRSHEGQVYIFRETPYPLDGLPADPARARSMELCPYSLEGITDIQPYSRFAVAGAKPPGVYPFRGWTGITVNQRAQDCYVHDNEIAGNLEKDAEGRFTHASDYGVGIFHAVNSPVSESGRGVRFENNVVRNIRVADIFWRDYADPSNRRGPAWPRDR